MKKFLFGLTVLGFALAFTACEDDGNGNTNPGDECVLDAECGTYACDLDSNKCYGSCTDDTQCGQGNTCDDSGACVPDDGNTGGGECASDDDCPDSTCNLETNTCVVDNNNGEVTYNRVLLVSRTANDKAATSSCRAENPGPDIDAVLLVSSGEEVQGTTASGDHGSYCGSQEPEWKGNPSNVLVQDSIPDEIPGECNLDSEKAYYYLGTGQDYTDGETIGEDTGYVVVTFDQDIADNDEIKVLEVNGSDNNDAEVCTNITTAYDQDTYGIYLVSSDAPDVSAGAVLTAPNFIKVGDDGYTGINSVLVTLDN